jgi:COP9 signalosome complex subunit 1
MMICPSIAPEAFQLCVQHIHQSREPALYQNLLQAYEQLATSPGLPLPNMMDLAQLDTKWADEIMAKNQTDRMKLEVELKTYSNNMIKESIRVSMSTASYGLSWLVEYV